MLSMQSLWKVRGVHILLLLTLFPFLILLGFAIQAIFMIPCIKGGWYGLLVFCSSKSSVAMQLTSPLASFCCCMTTCNVISLSTATSWKKNERYEGVSRDIVYCISHQVLDMWKTSWQWYNTDSDPPRTSTLILINHVYGNSPFQRTKC